MTSGLTLQQEPVREHPDAIRVTIDGSIDPKTVTGFKNELQALEARGVRRFLLDCAKLTYVNSSGLAYLLNLVGMVQPKGGMVSLAAVDSKIMVIFNMMGVAALFKFYPSADEAVREMDRKLAHELQDVGPAVKFDEPPKPAAKPPSRPAATPRPAVPTPRPTSQTNRIAVVSTRRTPVYVPPPNPIVLFFRRLFGLPETRPSSRSTRIRWK